MSETMQAAVLDGLGTPLRITRVQRPKPGTGEILIRLQASGVCHSDVHIWKGDMAPAVAPNPFILGHEGVGEVAAIGADVTGWAMGDRVGVAWLHDTCGHCAECLDGAEPFCQTQRAHGFDVPGTFAEYVVVNSKFAVRLPAGRASSLAPLLCAGITAYGAIQRAELVKGQDCAVFGCGGLGLYAVQLASRVGVRVVAIDPDPQKLALAQSFGAQRILRSHDQLARQWAAADQVHACINFAPTTATWDVMVAATRPRGRIVAAAMVAKPVALSQEWLATTGITVTGTSVGTRQQMAQLLALHAVNPLISEVIEIGLSALSTALHSLAVGQVKGRFCVVF